MISCACGAGDRNYAFLAADNGRLMIWAQGESRADQERDLAGAILAIDAARRAGGA